MLLLFSKGKSWPGKHTSRPCCLTQSSYRFILPYVYCTSQILVCVDINLLFSENLDKTLVKFLSIQTWTCFAQPTGAAGTVMQRSAERQGTHRLVEGQGGSKRPGCCGCCCCVGLQSSAQEGQEDGNKAASQSSQVKGFSSVALLI